MRALSVYVAGPLYGSGELIPNIEEAVHLGSYIEDEAREAGLELFCLVPHAVCMTQQFVSPRSHVAAQAWDDHWLRKCDALVYIPGESAGTRHERALALEFGLPTFRCDEIKRLIAWAKETT